MTPSRSVEGNTVPLESLAAMSDTDLRQAILNRISRCSAGDDWRDQCPLRFLKEANHDSCCRLINSMRRKVMLSLLQARCECAVDLYDFRPSFSAQGEEKTASARSKSSISKRGCRYAVLALYYIGLIASVLVVFLLIVLPVLLVGHGVRWIAAMKARASETPVHPFRPGTPGREPALNTNQP